MASCAEDFDPWIHPWPRRKQVVPILEQLLEHEDAEVRQRAVATLGQLTNLAAGAAPAMAKLLADEDEEVRSEAALALSNMGPWGEAALPDLERALLAPAAERPTTEESEDWLLHAVFTVRVIDPRSRHLLEKLLNHPDVHRRRYAMLFLSVQHERFGEPSVPALLQAADDPDEEVRSGALRAMGRVGAPGDEVTRTLERALDDPELSVRAAAAHSLWEIEGDAKRTLPHLIRGLDHAEAEFLDGILFVPVSPATIREALVAYPDGVPLLAEYVADATNKNRDIALEIFAELGEKGRAAEAVVRALLEDPDPEVRLAAAKALFAMAGDGPLLDILRGKLSSGRTEDIVSALDYLPTLGPKAADLVPALTENLSHKEDDVREKAAVALGAIGKKAERAVPRLRRKLDNAFEKAPVRWAAYEALAAIAFDTEDRLATLTKLLRSPDGSLRRRALEALVEEGPAALSRVERLDEMAKRHGSAELRWRAKMAAERIRAAVRESR